MSINDIFRSFFGFNRSGIRGHSDYFKEGDDEDFEDNSSDMNDPNENVFDIIIPHPESMFRHFEELFRNFGLQDFPPPQFGGPLPESPGDSHRSLRDNMLKNPEEPSSRYSQIPQPRSSQERCDIDLDKLNPDELEKVLISPNVMDPQMKQPSTFKSFFKSITVSTVRGSDGKVEQKKTIWDSSGNEETTVTRSVGDQSYSVTTKRNNSGLEEKQEDLINLDENQIGEFENKWSKLNISQDPRQDLVLSDVPQSDRSLFKKLFTSWF